MSTTNMPPAQKPFFETLPGILTALAALVTAIAGVLVILMPPNQPRPTTPPSENSSGSSGKSVPIAQPQPAAAQPQVPTAQQLPPPRAVIRVLATDIYARFVFATKPDCYIDSYNKIEVCTAQIQAVQILDGQLARPLRCDNGEYKIPTNVTWHRSKVTVEGNPDLGKTADVHGQCIDLNGTKFLLANVAPYFVRVLN
jgi:hypothetical protein